MDDCSSRNFHPKISKHGFALCYISATFIFLIIVPSVTALDCPANLNESILYEGDAFPSDNAVQLTQNTSKTDYSEILGRAMYPDPVRLWDRNTRKVIDFTARFSFSIDLPKDGGHGDGVTFFLARDASSIPRNSGCKSFVLADGDHCDTNDISLFSINFNLLRNAWDPDCNHIEIGIDLNSIISVLTVEWVCESLVRNNNAQVIYNSSTKILSVFSTYNDSPTSIPLVLDLKDYLPEWVTIGFCASTGAASQIRSLHNWNFHSSLETLESLQNKVPTKKRRWVIIFPCITGVLLGGFGLIWFLCWKNKKKWNGSTPSKEQIINHGDNGAPMKGRENMGEETHDVIINHTSTGDDNKKCEVWPKEFSFEELAGAANNFTDSMIGKGGFGGVYKGFLVAYNLDVAIKRYLRGYSRQGLKEYESEVKTISRLKHDNLVQLYGWCNEQDELLLVYEFLPNGSLFDHLFREKSLLKWKHRYKIVLDLARGVLHLHEESEQYVLHRDIKSNNVLLDMNFKAKLGDFGLARLVDQGKEPLTTYIAGTRGYLAPECATGRRQKPSKESDVYSFGILALEIGCGRNPIELVKGTEQQLVNWVWKLYGEGNILKAADQRLCKEFDEKGMKRLLVLGLWCAHQERNARPSIQEAINVLLEKTPLPELPHEMPSVLQSISSSRRADKILSSEASFKMTPSGDPNNC